MKDNREDSTYSTHIVSVTRVATHHVHEVVAIRQDGRHILPAKLLVLRVGIG